MLPLAIVPTAVCGRGGKGPMKPLISLSSYLTHHPSLLGEAVGAKAGHEIGLTRKNRAQNWKRHYRFLPES